jgi:hypothetical protein
VTDEELNAVAAGLPPVDLISARRRAEQEHAAAWEPTTIPMPEHLAGGIVRFPCPRGCPWFHDENPGRDAATERYVLVVPSANPTPEEVADAISRKAADRAAAVRERIERAVAAHDHEVHSGPTTDR